MAKCIRVVGQGIPVRMSDDDAFQIVVRDHDGDYCPKRVWKEYYDTPDKSERLTARLVGNKITATGAL